MTIAEIADQMEQMAERLREHDHAPGAGAGDVIAVHLRREDWDTIKVDMSRAQRADMETARLLCVAGEDSSEVVAAQMQSSTVLSKLYEQTMRH